MDLDEERGKNIGFLAGQKYFYCLEKHGSFVQAGSLEMADMSDHELVMKALLKGEMVSQKEVESLFPHELQFFFNRKELPFKVNQNKLVYVAMVVKYMAIEG